MLPIGITVKLKTQCNACEVRSLYYDNDCPLNRGKLYEINTRLVLEMRYLGKSNKIKVLCAVMNLQTRKHTHHKKLKIMYFLN